MQRDSEQTHILDELYKTTKMGMEAAEALLPRIRGKELSEQVRRQDETYINTMEKTRDLLQRAGREPAGTGRASERMVRGSVLMNTLLDRSAHRTAELMIKGSTLGITTVTSALNRAPDDGTDARRLAEEYIGAEEKNIDRLKKFL